MSKRGAVRVRTFSAALGGFLAGMAAMAAAVWLFPDVTEPGRRRIPDPVDQLVALERPALVVDAVGSRAVESRAGAPENPPPVEPLPAQLPSATPIIDADPVSELRDRHLDPPIRGLDRDQLHDSFDETRASHRHEAIDLMVPRGTPIVAVEDGVVARLFESKQGGTTVYQFDPETRYVYYYAHLERYAEGLAEGQQVQRGQVLGYAGTSGNAPKNAPHLHFAIFRLTEKKQWWQGAPIDPYSVFK